MGNLVAGDYIDLIGFDVTSYDNMVFGLQALMCVLLAIMSTMFPDNRDALAMGPAASNRVTTPVAIWRSSAMWYTTSARVALAVAISTRVSI